MRTRALWRYCGIGTALLVASGAGPAAAWTAGGDAVRFTGVAAVTQETAGAAPVPLAATSRAAAQVASGVAHVCALLDDGTVRCWGGNGSGELGLGTNAAKGDSPGELPAGRVPLGGAQTASAIVTGGYHSSALLDNGSVRCWGLNAVGQLGVGSTANLGDTAGELPSPTVPFGAGRTAVALAAGLHHTSALLDDGSVRCWGGNVHGQLGVGSTNDLGDSPGELPAALVPLGAGRTAVAIDAGNLHTCALLDDSTVRCWGRNVFGQLGIGSTTDRGDNPGELPTPVVALGGRLATALTAGAAHTCVVLADGTVRCWGNNAAGQLGIGSTTTRGDGPGELPAPAVPLGAGRTASTITAGDSHTCALLDDGTVQCWGHNFYGQLGVGSTTNQGDNPGELPAVPVPLGAGRTATGLTAGELHSCALLDDGTVHCWGHNHVGQLGVGSATVLGDNPGELPAPAVPLAFSALDGRLASGSLHTCALADDGTVHCWGKNDYGQLGVGSTTTLGDNPGELPAPAVPLGGHIATAITAGSFHTCAILDDGTVHCWGDNPGGQLGVGSTTSLGDNPGELPAPAVALGAGRTATAIAAGGFHTCAILDDGTVHCWGDNPGGQLGVGSTTDLGDNPGELPAPAVPLDGHIATALIPGNAHSCAILDDGTVRCWGSNTSGQLGVGSTTDLGDNPGELPAPAVALGAGRTATAITGGGYHTCALLDDGTVRCWGDNFFGQLGVGSTTTLGDNPGELPAPAVALGAGRTATAITGGGYHTCAILDDGTVHCWGMNASGRLGVGSTTSLGDNPGELPAPAVALGAGRTATAITARNAHTCTILDDGTVHCWGDNTSGQLGVGSTTDLGDNPGELPAPAVPTGDTLTIATVRVADARIQEADSRVKYLTFRLTRSNPSGAVAVAYRTTDGTARDDRDDYEPLAGQALFAPGAFHTTVRVPVHPDRRDEPDETVTLLLATPEGARLADPRGLGTIVDDDPEPDLRVGDATVTETTGAAATLTVQVRLSEVSGRSVSVQYATAPGTATAPADYTTRSGTVTIPAGSRTANITISVAGDAVVEGTESFYIGLTSPTNATIDDGAGWLLIFDDD